MNHPESDHIPASGHYFVFQRIDCPQCLIGVRADIEGKYRVFLGAGRYRLISVNPKDETEDYLRGQVREITVEPPPNDLEFNIKLVYPDSILRESKRLKSKESLPVGDGPGQSINK